MKFKKTLSALLAAAVVFSLLCVPASAAANPILVDFLDRIFVIDVDDAEPLRTQIQVQGRFWEAGLDAAGNPTYTLGQATPKETVTVCQLPLGVTLTAGPYNPWVSNMVVLSDPDGDGVYIQRLEEALLTEEERRILPVTETGPLTEADTSIYSGIFDWGFGADYFESGANDEFTGYRTITTDYLVDKFGPNTLMFVMNELTNEIDWFLLTGEERPAELPVVPLEAGGIYITPYGGHLVSKWALEPVNNASEAGLIPYDLELAHDFDFTGQITRGEFASVTLELYCAMAGVPISSVYGMGQNPFADVSSDDPFYGYILGASSLGIVLGDGTTFRPDDLVSRQDAALMLSRVYTKLGGTLPDTASTTFADNAQIVPYAIQAVAFMSSKGIINGRGDNFDPTGKATVEEALKIALEMLNRLDA